MPQKICPPNPGQPVSDISIKVVCHAACWFLDEPLVWQKFGNTIRLKKTPDALEWESSYTFDRVINVGPPGYQPPSAYGYIVRRRERISVYMSLNTSTAIWRITLLYQMTSHWEYDHDPDPFYTMYETDELFTGPVNANINACTLNLNHDGAHNSDCWVKFYTLGPNKY